MGNEINTQPAAEPAEIQEPAAEPSIIVDEDVMLPADYEEGKPYSFEESDTPAADPAEDLPADPADPAPDQVEDQPEVKEDPAADQSGTAAEGDPADPAAAEEPVGKTYKFTDTFQGMSREVELNYDDIPAMYRKAQTTDFVVRRTNEHEGKARALGYESVDDMLAKVRTEKIEREVAELVDDHVHETIARDVVSRKYPEYALPARQQTAAPVPTQPAQPVRNIDNELAELHAAYPDLRGQKLPQEVTSAAMGGKHLLSAYNEFLIKHNNEELSRLRKENETLRQNAAAAAKAPVKSVTAGGATDTKPTDDFLLGFNSAYK